MEQTKIYYFSGTGNCLAIAKMLHQQLSESKIYAIASENDNPHPQIECENLVIIFPSYAYRMPSLVKSFIKRAEIKCNYIAVACSYGSKPGGVFTEARRLLKRKGLTLSYGMRIKSVENYIPMFGVAKEEKIPPLHENMKRLTDEFALKIINKQTNKPKGYFFGSGFIAFMFKRAKWLFPKFYKVLPCCTGCGLCARLCPADAITMVDSKPVFSSKCQHCQGCFNYCPTKAIKYKGYSPKSRRYTHPLVKASELNAKNKTHEAQQSTSADENNL